MARSAELLLELIRKQVLIQAEKLGLGHFQTEFKALTTITFPHEHIHKGETFEACFKSPEGGDIANDANLSVLLTTGAKQSHFTFEAAISGDGELQFFESVVTSNDGTPLTELNMNRNSATVALGSAFHTPTVTDIGVQLISRLIPAGTGGNAAGATLRTGTEWILAPDTNYMVRVINRAGGSKPVSIALQWYEHDIELV